MGLLGWSLTRVTPTTDLEARLEKLERSQKDLRVDWDLTFEKFSKLAARLAKRDKREREQLEQNEETNGDEPVDPYKTKNPLARRILMGSET